MRRRAAALASFTLALVALVAPAARAALPEAAARLERTMRATGGLRADFVQIRIVELTGEEIEATGFIAFRPPSAFRLAYVDPDPQEIVVTGDSLWVYMPADGQAIRYSFDAAAPGSEIFLLFGGGERRIEDAYEVVEERWADRADALRLTPRDVEPGYPIEEIRLLVDRGGFPERLFYRELGGDAVVFRFTRITVRPPDLDALVRLRIPAGTEILDGDELQDRETPDEPGN